MRLLAGPRAAGGLAQAPDGANEPVELRVRRRRLPARRILLVYQLRQGTPVIKPALRLPKPARLEPHESPSLHALLAMFQASLSHEGGSHARWPPPALSP